MTLRLAHVSRLVALAALLGVVGGTGWSSPAAACSCVRGTSRQAVEQALVLVSGEPVDRWTESVDGHEHNVWAFRVDERWVGVTPDVIETQAIAFDTSCGPPTELDSSILLLGRKESNGRFDVSSGCSVHMLDRALVDRLFGPPELHPAGAPVAVVSADAGDHAAKLVDADGRAIRYLPGGGETHGLAPCPGGDHFLQLRGGSGDRNGLARSFELATWRYDGWTEVAAHTVESPEAIDTSETLVCLRPDGGDALIVWSSYLEATRVVEAVARAEMTVEQPVDVPGPDGAVFRFRRERHPQVVDGINAVDVTWELGGGETMSISDDNLMSVVPAAGGWDLTVDDWVDVSTTASQFGFRVISLGVDGKATTSSEFVPILTSGWANGLLIPTAHRTTAGLAAAVPSPLFERNGQALVTPATVPAVEVSTEPTAVAVVDSTTGPASDAATTRSGSTDLDAAGDVDDGTAARWIAGGILMLVVVGGALLVMRRSGGRGVESSPGGGRS